jgi:hypothetical protein
MDAWMNGILYADRPGLAIDVQGVPLCCQAAAPQPGGMRIGGQGNWTLGIQTSQGGNCQQFEHVSDALGVPL